MLEYAFEEMRKKGFEMRIVSIDHLSDLNDEMEKLYKEEVLGRDIYNFLKGFYDLRKPDTSFDVKSFVVVASPSPIIKIHFHYKNKKIPVFIPPTYREFIEAPADIENNLNHLIGRDNYHVERAHHLPEKLLSVHSGLSQYGRNNISYIPSMGSFLLLSAFYSDIPYQDSEWHDTQMMKACDKCTKCIDACPTGAILAERFLVDAERCITYQNEFNTGDSFPDWIEPSSHNCVIGCMHCQLNCPQNKKYLSNIVEAEEFDSEETNYILEKGELESLPEALVIKLERLNLKIYYHVLARNLKVLLDRDI